MFVYFYCHDCCADSFMKASNITKSSPKTMAKTIQHLVDQYGSPENYIREIGISDEEINILRKRLCKEGQRATKSTAVNYNDADRGAHFDERE